MWRETTLLCDKAVEITNAQTYVFSDSVLCLGGIGDRPVEAWKKRTKWFSGRSLSQRFGSHRRRAGGVRVEIAPGFTRLQILAEIQKMMAELQCEPKQFLGRIIFIDKWKRGNREDCIANAHGEWTPEVCERVTKKDVNTIHRQLRIMLADFLAVIFLGAWIRREGTYTNRPDGSWNQSAEIMVANFSGSGHPMFRASSALERGELGSKGGGKKSIHCAFGYPLVVVENTCAYPIRT